MFAASFFKEDSPMVQQRFFQVAATFSILSLVCNHPHFMVSYRFGYGRGSKFLFQHWISLIFVPLTLLLIYTVGYFFFDTNIEKASLLNWINPIFETLGIGFRLGQNAKLGYEILSLSILIMYFTAGWHYSKQVYGCMMTYSKFNNYPLLKWQKKILKWSVFSVAFYQLVYMFHLIDTSSSSGYQDSRFAGIQLTTMDLPESLIYVAGTLVGVLFVLSLSIFIFNFRKYKTLPALNVLVPWIAFYIWWIPFVSLPEFYFMMVPFFHSLQYLPFAYRMENSKIKKDQWYYLQVTARLSLLLAIGVACFEWIPVYLDLNLKTEAHQTAWFFMTAFAVFINIHHFFIDSVVWKSTAPSTTYKSA